LPHLGLQNVNLNLNLAFLAWNKLLIARNGLA
jgi:hypothetical protein